MKRDPIRGPKVFDDAQAAGQYAASAASRNKNLSKVFANALARRGFRVGKLLDAGAGAGDVAIELAKVFPEAEIVGLDLSESLLEIARASAAKAGGLERLSFRLGDVQAMPFEDGTFGAVISLNVFHLVDNPVAMLNEVERVLAPNGIAFLSDIRRSWLGLLMPILKTAYSPGEVRELLQHSRLRQHTLHDQFPFAITIEV